MGLLQLISEAPSSDFKKFLKRTSSSTIDKIFSVTSFRELIDVCKNNFNEIGSGSSRKAYMIEDNFILKIAYNSKGVGQNEQEEEISRLGWYDNIIAKVYLMSDNGRIMLCEYAEPFKDGGEDKIMEQMGLSISFIDKMNDEIGSRYTSEDELFHDIIDYIAIKHKEQPPETVYKALNYIEKHHPDGSDQLFFELMDMVANFGYDEAAIDFNRSVQWGVNDKGDPVLIDYGFTKHVAEKHYKINF